MDNVAAETRSVWKVFGSNAKECVVAAKEHGLSRSEIQERFGCVVAVQEVSIRVMRGEIFCVMGLSGSGKSTLIRHFNRLLEPTAGKIIVGGEDIGTKNDVELRAIRSSKIGMVFQNFALLPHRTVRENVALPLEINGRSRLEQWTTAEQTLAMVGLEAWGDHRTHELSGGMQQRVGLARALASSPDLLLMDEPFSALDPLIRRQLQDEFVKLKDNMSITTIFITHDLDEAIRIGDQIAIMKDGKIIQVGTPEQIVLSPQDDYVAEFVSGISTVNFVRAQDIMRPLSGKLDQSSAAARVAPETTLNELLDLAIGGSDQIFVASGGNDVGLISTADLLRGIKGNAASA